MKVITLKRIVKDSPDGTFGVWIMDDGYPYFTSVELPWKNNAHDISCTTTGEFIGTKIKSPHFGYDVFKFDVPNRPDIEAHIANSIKDLKGCYGVGSRFGVVETKDSGPLHGVLESSIAFNQFMAMLKNDQQIKLVVTE